MFEKKIKGGLGGDGSVYSQAASLDEKTIEKDVDSANMWELAEVAKNLGLKGALNLDGGVSCGLYYNGAYVKHPGRLLSNCLVVTQ